MTHWNEVSVDIAGSPADAIRSLTRVTTVGRHTRVASMTSDALVIDDQWRPFWTRCAAVMVFPVGLLGLVHRRRAQLVILTRSLPGEMTEVTLTGEASKHVTAALWQVIEDSLPSVSDVHDSGGLASGRSQAIRLRLLGLPRAQALQFTAS